MKKSIKLIAFCTAFALIAGLFGCTTDEAPALDVRVQELSYTESCEKLDNPDQGFYRPISVKMTADGATYNKNIVNASTQLYHLRTDISAFSSNAGGHDGDFTEEALAGLKELLGYLNERGKSAVFRMAYDKNYGGNANGEPPLTQILRHISQVAPVLESFPQTVTAIEVGLIGPWGEMHTSTMAKPENITAITGRYLDETQSIPVLVRTPKMIYDYLGITVKDIDGYTVEESSPAYRLGLFNDGYLGSANDLGTYTDREREVKFLKNQNAHLPYGGEVVVPDSHFHDIDKCTGEMFELSLSYLNIEWNNNVIDKWKNSVYTAECGSDEAYYGASAFDYIQNRLGYRFVITESAFKYDGDGLTEISLKIENVGFGNMNKPKKAKLILCNEDGEAYTELALNDFFGQSEYSSSVSFTDAGEYRAYLCVYGSVLNGAPNYAVKFANPDVWNGQLQANYIGTVKK